MKTIRPTLLSAVIALCAAMPALAAGAPPPHVRNPIQHVVIIMQENRSFDSYFGTFPGANGIPPGTCVPLNPANPQNGCVMPFHDPHDRNAAGPHGNQQAQADIDDGITTAKMDGFVYEQTIGRGGSGSLKAADQELKAPEYLPGADRHDVMGYHTDAEIPNYWAYARNFVLQDEMFEGVRAWSLSSHVDLVSEWVALCKNANDVSTCVTQPTSKQTRGTQVEFPWVNLFQLMDTHGVSWKYYLAQGQEPDCDDDEMTCAPEYQTRGVVSLWNPAPGFAWVEAQGGDYLTEHNPDIDQFLIDVKNGTLPQVAWVVPNSDFSEHPSSSIAAGEDYVTSMINAIMASPYWRNTAIFLAWDDWGGFYDHVVPPIVDLNHDKKTPVQGFGLRVPGLLISAYAKPGYIDHNVLSADSYATFIEDIFMNGTRLDPVQMGEPDARPDIRDALTSVTFMDGTTRPIGLLRDEFDFEQAPRNPLILSPYSPSAIRITCQSKQHAQPQKCTANVVQISWNAVTGPQIPGPFTYQVMRDGVVVAACTGTATDCVDRDVPSGVHQYTARSLGRDFQTSPASPSAEADVP